MGIFTQVYDPFNNEILSTVVAAFPIVLLLGLIATGKIKSHWAALIALVAMVLVAIAGFHMPTEMARHKTEGRARKLIVAGCLVERYRDEIQKNIPEVRRRRRHRRTGIDPRSRRPCARARRALTLQHPRHHSRRDSPRKRIAIRNAQISLG